MWMLCPRVDAISPDWFEDGFVEKEQPVHLIEGESELLPFGEYMAVPGELSILMWS
jgi:hypothetical protein